MLLECFSEKPRIQNYLNCRLFQRYWFLQLWYICFLLLANIHNFIHKLILYINYFIWRTFYLNSMACFSHTYFLDGEFRMILKSYKLYILLASVWFIYRFFCVKHISILCLSSLFCLCNISENRKLWRFKGKKNLEMIFI